MLNLTSKFSTKLENFIFTLMFLLIGTATSAFAQSEPVAVDEYTSGKIFVVAPGNKLAVSPPVPRAPEPYFLAALKMFKKNNMAKMLDEVAPLYGVTPLQILGPIIGEHTFNTDVYDWMQGIYINMTKRWVENFNSRGINLGELLRQAPFQQCMQYNTSYLIWDCYQAVWLQNYAGKNGFPYKTLKFTFFDPNLAGCTFGIGQLDPVRALMVADVVGRTMGRTPISIDRPVDVYNAILDDRTAVHYIAANIAAIINTYEQEARFDISKNIGIIATLYNLGSERQKAKKKFNENLKALPKNGGKLLWPEENFYGWYVNSKETVLREWLKINGSVVPN